MYSNKQIRIAKEFNEMATVEKTAFKISIVSSYGCMRLTWGFLLSSLMKFVKRYMLPVKYVYKELDNKSLRLKNRLA